MLKTRVITAIIGIIIAVGAVTMGGILFNAILFILALVGWNEYFSMFRKVPSTKVWSATGALGILLVLGPMIFGLYKISLFLLVLSVISMAVYYTLKRKGGELSTLMNTVGGFFYVATGLASLMILRDSSMYESTGLAIENVEMGVLIIWLLLLTTWASDTFAYFAGRFWGMRKIVPHISPNKTLEGFVGGFVGCVIVGALYAFIVGVPFYMGLGVGIIVGIVAPLGDLFESKLKRYAGIKDSGQLLPGHGGFLDRFDSLLFAAPAVLAYVLLW